MVGTHSGGVLERGHFEGIFRVTEVCGMVCNMKTAMFVSPRMVMSRKALMYPG